LTNTKGLTDLRYLKLHITETIRLIENHWYAVSIAVTDGHPALITTAMEKQENHLGFHILATPVGTINIAYSKVSTVVTVMMMTLTINNIGNGTENSIDLNVEIVHLLVVKRMTLEMTSLGSPEDNSVGVGRGSKQVKLQRFTVPNCGNPVGPTFKIVHNITNGRHMIKLAFLKSVLTGNTAQVLLDTDCVTMGSFRKLVSMLKSRYSGERQDKKYRVELQIRRLKPHQTLSDLHQDIRRMIALAYPKLKAQAREEIACDHFTTAIGDPEFALKVKERVPRSLDEALRIALHLEAWAKQGICT